MRRPHASLANVLTVLVYCRHSPTCQAKPYFVLRRVYRAWTNPIGITYCESNTTEPEPRFYHRRCYRPDALILGRAVQSRARLPVAPDTFYRAVFARRRHGSHHARGGEKTFRNMGSAGSGR